MATKTFRSIYLNDDLDGRLLKCAEQEDSSVSRLVRIALEQFLESRDVDRIYCKSENQQMAMAV